MIWEASEEDGSQERWMKEPACPPFQMGTGVWYATCMNAHHSHDRKQ